MQRILISLMLAVAFSAPAIAQDASARTVQYHSQDIVPIRAKMKFTTLIQVPPTEKIMEAATGDKDFWVVDVVGNFCFVHPAKAGTSNSARRRWNSRARASHNRAEGEQRHDGTDSGRNQRTGAQ